MGKFGKKTHVSLNPLDCSLILLGSPKIGKTTLMKEVAEKLVGDGYMFLEMYREAGASKIEGIISEPVEDWAKFKEIVEDIEENKDTDYPDLKCVFIDTWDNAILLAEQEALRLWNKNHSDEKADSINAAWSGFGRGQDKAADLLDDMKYRLEAVGVKVSIIMHIKSKEIVDPISEKAFQQVTADVSQKYFNRIKRNVDLIAVAYVDRVIATENTGRKDIKKKDITINVVKEEARKIKYRDSGYAIDAGGRLAHIVEESDFTADAFIKSVTDALAAEVTGAGVSLKDREKEDKQRAKEEIKTASENSAKAKANKIDLDRNEELLATIKENFSNISDAETKKKFKELMAKYEVTSFKDVSETPTASLEALAAFFE